jgi:hypothetical protein
MELTFTNFMMIIGGLLALTVGLAIYVFFNGGTDTIMNMVLGVIGK